MCHFHFQLLWRGGGGALYFSTSSVFDTQGIHTATFGRLCLPSQGPHTHVTLLAHIAPIPQSIKKDKNCYFLDCAVKSADIENFNQILQ